MKKARLSPISQFADVERYHGCNRRDTRRVRAKIFNYCKSHRQHRDYYMPGGLCNSWIVNGYTFTPMWVRPVPRTEWGADHFVLLVHEDVRLIGWFRCFEQNNCFGTRDEITLPNGCKFFSDWHECGLNGLLHCSQFYRPYEEPTKDLADFDIWRERKRPCNIADKIVKKALVKRGRWRGTMKPEYMKNYRMDIMMETARRERNATIVKRGGNSAKFNIRQLRALGVIA